MTTQFLPPWAGEAQRSPQAPHLKSKSLAAGNLEQRMKMIMNQNKIRKTSRITRAAIVLGAAVAMPLGLSYADSEDKWEGDAKKDAYKAPTLDEVKLRLDAAVKEGKLTQKQADQKLEFYKNKKGKDGGMRARYRAYEKELKDKVAAGELTEEEAKEKLMHMKKGIASASKKKDAYAAPTIEQVKERLDAAVKAGRLSQEDADKKLEHYKKRRKAE